MYKQNSTYCISQTWQPILKLKNITGNTACALLCTVVSQLYTIATHFEAEKKTPQSHVPQHWLIILSDLVTFKKKLLLSYKWPCFVIKSKASCFSNNSSQLYFDPYVKISKSAWSKSWQTFDV